MPTISATVQEQPINLLQTCSKQSLSRTQAASEIEISKRCMIARREKPQGFRNRQEDLESEVHLTFGAFRISKHPVFEAGQSIFTQTALRPRALQDNCAPPAFVYVHLYVCKCMCIHIKELLYELETELSQKFFSAIPGLPHPLHFKRGVQFKGIITIST